MLVPTFEVYPLLLKNNRASFIFPPTPFIDMQNFSYPLIHSVESTAAIPYSQKSVVNSSKNVKLGRFYYKNSLLSPGKIFHLKLRFGEWYKFMS